jgi:hypothetical protein
MTMSASARCAGAWSSAGRHGTRWRLFPSSIIAKRLFGKGDLLCNFASQRLRRKSAGDD